jgi:hypothetical protein
LQCCFFPLGKRQFRPHIKIWLPLSDSANPNGLIIVPPGYGIDSATCADILLAGKLGVIPPFGCDAAMTDYVQDICQCESAVEKPATPAEPSAYPSDMPSDSPSEPELEEAAAASAEPSALPSDLPSDFPSDAPSMVPTAKPLKKEQRTKRNKERTLRKRGY